MVKKLKSGKFNLKTRLRSAIRLVWLRSPIRYEILRRARTERGLYECSLCLDKFPIKEMQVDHIIPIGSIGLHDSKLDFTEFVYRMFYTEMQAVCYDCHKKKTRS